LKKINFYYIYRLFNKLPKLIKFTLRKNWIKNAGHPARSNIRDAGGNCMKFTAWQALSGALGAMANKHLIYAIQHNEGFDEFGRLPLMQWIRTIELISELRSLHALGANGSPG
jgi:hypothetical protein